MREYRAPTHEAVVAHDVDAQQLVDDALPGGSFRTSPVIEKQLRESVRAFTKVSRAPITVRVLVIKEPPVWSRRSSSLGTTVHYEHTVSWWTCGEGRDCLRVHISQLVGMLGQVSSRCSEDTCLALEAAGEVLVMRVRRGG